MPITDWSPHVNGPASQKETRLAVTAAINELPGDDRTVLVLREVEGLSTVETADLLGLNVPTVKSRVHRDPAAGRGSQGPLTTYVDHAPRQRIGLTTT